MIITGAVKSWVIAQVQKSTPWKEITVHHPSTDQDDVVAVLMLPVATAELKEAERRVREALGLASPEGSGTEGQ